MSEKIINSEAVPLFAALYVKSNLRIANPVYKLAISSTSSYVVIHGAQSHHEFVDDLDD